jgi:hypothetical protein
MVGETNGPGGGPCVDCSWGTAEQTSPLVATMRLLVRRHVGLSLAFSGGLSNVRAFPAAERFVEQVAEMGPSAAGV